MASLSSFVIRTSRHQPSTPTAQSSIDFHPIPKAVPSEPHPHAVEKRPSVASGVDSPLPPKMPHKSNQRGNRTAPPLVPPNGIPPTSVLQSFVVKPQRALPYHPPPPSRQCSNVPEPPPSKQQKEDHRSRKEEQQYVQLSFHRRLRTRRSYLERNTSDAPVEEEPVGAPLGVGMQRRLSGFNRLLGTTSTRHQLRSLNTTIATSTSAPKHACAHRRGSAGGLAIPSTQHAPIGGKSWPLLKSENSPSSNVDILNAPPSPPTSQRRASQSSAPPIASSYHSAQTSPAADCTETSTVSHRTLPKALLAGHLLHPELDFSSSSSQASDDESIPSPPLRTPVNLLDVNVISAAFYSPAMTSNAVIAVCRVELGPQEDWTCKAPCPNPIWNSCLQFTLKDEDAIHFSVEDNRTSRVVAGATVDLKNVLPYPAMSWKGSIPLNAPRKDSGEASEHGDLGNLELSMHITEESTSFDDRHASRRLSAPAEILATALESEKLAEMAERCCSLCTEATQVAEASYENSSAEACLSALRSAQQASSSAHELFLEIFRITTLIRSSETLHEAQLLLSKAREVMKQVDTYSREAQRHAGSALAISCRVQLKKMQKLVQSAESYGKRAQVCAQDALELREKVDEEKRSPQARGEIQAFEARVKKEESLAQIAVEQSREMLQKAEDLVAGAVKQKHKWQLVVDAETEIVDAVREVRALTATVMEHLRSSRLEVKRKMRKEMERERALKLRSTSHSALLQTALLSQGSDAYTLDHGSRALKHSDTGSIVGVVVKKSRSQRKACTGEPLSRQTTARQQSLPPAVGGRKSFLSLVQFVSHKRSTSEHGGEQSGLSNEQRSIDSWNNPTSTSVEDSDVGARSFQLQHEGHRTGKPPKRVSFFLRQGSSAVSTGDHEEEASEGSAAEPQDVLIEGGIPTADPATGTAGFAGMWKALMCR